MATGTIPNSPQSNNSARDGITSKPDIRAHDPLKKLEEELRTTKENVTKLEKRNKELQSEKNVLTEQEGRCEREKTELEGRCEREKTELESKIVELEKKSRWYYTCTERRWTDLRLMITKPQELDICYLIDATESMEATFTTVREQVRDITNSIKAAYPACDLKLALVIYRDFPQEPVAQIACPFTSNFSGEESLFDKILSNVEAVGGNDVAENVLTGLEEVANLDWRATKNRLLLHIGDAPCHGKSFHNLKEGQDFDEYREGPNKSLPVYESNVCNALDQLRVECKVTRYVFLHVNSSTTVMIAKFKQLIEKSVFKNIPKGEPAEGFNLATTTKYDKWIDEVLPKEQGGVGPEGWPKAILEVCKIMLKFSINVELLVSFMLAIDRFPVEAPVQPEEPPKRLPLKRRPNVAKPVHNHPGTWGIVEKQMTTQ